jgi:hypothetical protein
MTAVSYANGPKAFGPQAFRMLLDSFDEALRSLTPAQLSAVATPQMRDQLARHIISMAEHGELDPERLRQGAVAHVNMMLRYYRGQSHLPR